MEGDRDGAGEILLPGLRDDQPGAVPFHVIPRGWAGPTLLAMIVFEKFGQHQPLNRQAERYAVEGAPIALKSATSASPSGPCRTVTERIDLHL